MQYKDLALRLQYDPETGTLRHRARTGDTPYVAAWNTKFAGKAITSKDQHGYLRVALLGVRLSVARVAWTLFYKEPPVGCIDHINGIRDDNRICNLRIVSKGENAKNSKRRKDNKSGITGVTWDSVNLRWKAHIRVNNKQITVGRYVNLGDAVFARKEAEKLYNFHPNHGRG